MTIHLLEIRNKLGLSQVQVAELCKLSKSTVSNIENGNVDPKFSQIEALAKGLGLTIRDIAESDYY